MSTLVQFEAATHTYRDHAGSEIPSVTQILKSIGLVDYSGIDPDVLARKAWIGTQVHLATRFFDEDDLEWSTVGEVIEPRVRAWEKFRKESGFKPVGESEKPRICVANGMRFAMTADVTGFIGNAAYVIEKKCAEEEECWWKVQLAAYECGLRSEDQQFRRRMSVQLRGDATYRTFVYGDVVDYQIFNSALAIEWWKRQYMRRRS